MIEDKRRTSFLRWMLNVYITSSNAQGDAEKELLHVKVILLSWEYLGEDGVRIVLYNYSRVQLPIP